MTLNKVAAAAAALCLAACASAKPTPMTADIATYHGQPVTIVTHDFKSGFNQMTAGNAMFGALGAIAAIGESEKLVDKYDLRSPAFSVAEQMKTSMGDRFKTQDVKMVSDPSGAAKTDAALAALAGKQGVVLDVQPGVWQSIYFPTDWTHYKILYFSAARLVDASSGKFLASAPCKYETKDAAPPTYDALYADNAKLMKADLQLAADDCAGQMAKGLFDK